MVLFLCCGDGNCQLGELSHFDISHLCFTVTQMQNCKSDDKKTTATATVT